MALKALAPAMASMLAVLLSGCSRSPESTVERFYRAVGKGEITEAQAYVSSEVVGILGEDKLRATLAEESQRVSSCGGIRSVNVQLNGQGEIRTGSAFIMYNGQCQPKSETAKLVKEDGKWKIGVSK